MCTLTNQSRLAIQERGDLKETGTKTQVAVPDSVRTLLCTKACKHILVVTQNKMINLKISIYLL